MAAMPPTRRKTTAATAWRRMNVCPVRQTGRPVVSQTRTRPGGWLPGGRAAGRSAVRVGALISVLLVFDDDAAGHRVVPDATEFVAQDRERSGTGGRQRQHVVVARHNLEVHVERLQRESVLQIERRNVDAVG